MARELGLHPKKFGDIYKTRQEPWRLQLPGFIEKIYNKCFNKKRSDSVSSIEQMEENRQQGKSERKGHKQTGSTKSNEVVLEQDNQYGGYYGS